MITLNRTFTLARRGLALSALLGASLLAAQAQQAVSATTSEPTLNLQLPAMAPEATFSSSSQDNDVAVADNHFDFLAVTNAQPPSRRSYGRPRYRGNNTNADGSNKWAFMAGAGFGTPTQNLDQTNNTGWGFQVGGGRNFSKTFGLLVQYDYDHFGLNGATRNSQLNLYNQIITYYNAGQIAANQVPLLDSLNGSTHVWSFTLDPTVSLYSGEGLGAYVVGGVGFYHKVTDFTTPGVSEYCDPYYGCYEYQADQVIDHYTSNAPGFNGGFGVTLKFSRFTNERLYGEARYVYIVNSQRAGITAATLTAANAGAYNDYPANSNRTSYIPIKFGIRF